MEGEIIRRKTMSTPMARPPLTIGRSGRLVALAGMALSAAGNWLLPRATDALVGTVERRLAGRSTSSTPILHLQSRPIMRQMDR